MNHPIQPVVADAYGVLRFKKNAIVRHLLDSGLCDMNVLALLDFSQEDRVQFAQLIGYSLSGFGELSYVDSDTYDAAARMAEGVSEVQATNQVLSEKLELVRKHLKELVPEIFHIHPDDLQV